MNCNWNIAGKKKIEWINEFTLIVVIYSLTTRCLSFAHVHTQREASMRQSQIIIMFDSRRKMFVQQVEQNKLQTFDVSFDFPPQLLLFHLGPWAPFAQLWTERRQWWLWHHVKRLCLRQSQVRENIWSVVFLF